MATMSIYDYEVPDDTHDYYDVTFYDDEFITLVTATPSFVDMWISDIERIHWRRLHHLVVGLDVEWRPNINSNYQNPIATLQLCVGRRCLIFQILHSNGIPWSLINFLRNPDYTFCGVGIGDDVAKLRRDYNLVVSKTEDIRFLAVEELGQVEFRNAGLKGLTRRVMGKEWAKPKGITLSNWDNRWLNYGQVQYACIDAFLSFEIARMLISGDFD